MRYMNGDDRFKVVSVAAWCAWHTLEDSRRFGAALRQAIEQSDSRVAVLASGSLSHRFNDNGSGEATMHEISREFFRQVDLRVVDLWRQGDWKTFCAMLPEYADLCVARAACTIPPCCWACWAGMPTTSRRRSSPSTSPAPARAS